LQNIRVYAQSVPSIHGCGLDAMPLGGSGINNRMTK